MRAHLHMQAITIESALDGAGVGVLIVRIQVSCEMCGEHEFVVAGHHLKPLVEMLQSVVDEVDPALVDAGEGASRQRTWHHIPDPRNN